MNRHEQEKLEAELELLNLRLATAEVECEKIQQELLANELLENQVSQTQSSQIRAASKASGRGVHLATASDIAFITLSEFSDYHDALSSLIVSNMTDNSQLEASTMRDLTNGSIIHGD